MCVGGAVLQRPDAGQQRWDERGLGEDQSDPDGEISQTAGCPQNSGKLTDVCLQVTSDVSSSLDGSGQNRVFVQVCLSVFPCAAGVARQRAGEERSDGSRWRCHDAAETDCRSVSSFVLSNR